MRRDGFTLVEVVGAMTAFSLAFLVGTAAFTRLLQHQQANYQRTLAGIAAMTWSKSGGDLAATQTACDTLSPPPPAGHPRLFVKAEHVTGVSEIDHAQGVCFWYGNPNPLSGTYQDASVFLARYHNRY